MYLLRSHTSGEHKDPGKPLLKYPVRHLKDVLSAEEIEGLTESEQAIAGSAVLELARLPSLAVVDEERRKAVVAAKSTAPAKCFESRWAKAVAAGVAEVAAAARGLEQAAGSSEDVIAAAQHTYEKASAAATRAEKKAVAARSNWEEREADKAVGQRHCVGMPFRHGASGKDETTEFEAALGPANKILTLYLRLLQGSGQSSVTSNLLHCAHTVGSAFTTAQFCSRGCRDDANPDEPDK